MTTLHIDLGGEAACEVSSICEAIDDALRRLDRLGAASHGQHLDDNAYQQFRSRILKARAVLRRP
jgi:hypothetical protein